MKLKSLTVSIDKKSNARISKNIFISVHFTEKIRKLWVDVPEIFLIKP